MLVLGGKVSVGGEFDSLTVIWKLCVVLRLGEPLSKTRIVTVFVLGPCASLGIQLMAPLVLTVRFVGPETKANVNMLVGASASVAVAVRLSGTSSVTI